MRLEYRQLDLLPRLAWCAQIHHGDATVRVDHGPWVEVQEEYFFEGAWNGPFEQGRFDQASVMIGSGARLIDEAITFVSPTNKIDPLYWMRVADEVWVSNSLVFVLTRTGDELDPSYPYYFADFLLLYRKAAAAPKSVHTARGNRVHLIEHGNMVIDSELSVQRREKAELGPPNDYRSLVGGLVREIDAVLTNARHENRRQTFRPVVTLSRGYDSPAVAALVSAAGGREAVTFSHSAGRPTGDDGTPIAQRLGMECVGYDKLGYKSIPGLPEAEFCAAGHVGIHTTFATMEDQLRGGVLCHGNPGRQFWGPVFRKYGPVSVGPDYSFLGARHIGAASLTEFRLRAGFFSFPVPSIGVIHHPLVQAIANSNEMKPWSVGGEYDRPVPRRIAEEAGIPRELFGQKKYGHSHQWLMKPERFGETSRADYLAYYTQLRDRAMGINWLERHFMYSMLSLVNRTTRRLMKVSLGKHGRRIVPLPDRFLVQRMRWEMCFTQHWGIARIQDRYAVPTTG